MASIPATGAEDNTLFEIDAELEAQFEAAMMEEEEEETGVISEEAKQRCLELFAELGKKVDRIARYLRATEFKARAAKEEAARLTARQRTAENRVAQVKSMLAFYMLSHGLRRLEGELNTFRLQKNGQAALEIDASALPQSYYLRTLTLTEPDWE
jgi:outer membrane murein-binding lipoprotein Lpp